ncbi:MAG: tetratricopeptide repeat protein [Bryobacteraceae bacterium]
MKRIPAWHFAAIILICILAYGNSLSGELVWDDEVQIAQNPVIRDLSNIPSAFTQAVWAFLDPGAPNQSNFYRPLQTVAYILGYAVGGLSPVPYHVTSLILHTLASVAVYAVCLELGFVGLLPLLGAALFAAHPIHTEAVSWIAAVPEVACGLFYFAALWAFLKSDSGARRVWLFASAFLFFLALLSKEMAVTLPAVLFLITFRPEGRQLPLARRFALLIPHGVFAAIYLAMRIHALGFLGLRSVHLGQATASTFDWLTLGVQAFGQYIRLVLVPYPLIAYHMLPLHFGDRIGSTLASLGIIAAIVGLAWKHRQRVPEGIFWLAAFALMLIPMFNLRGISAALMSERYLYIPSLAPIVVGLILIRRSKSQHWIWAAWALAGLFTLATIVRNQDWSSAQRLYTTTLEREPDAGDFHVELAKILEDRKDDRNAILHFNQALKILSEGKYNQVPYDVYRIHINVAALFLRLGDFDKASAHLDAAARVNPQGDWPLVYGGAIRLARYADDAGAVTLLQSALKINPNNETAHDFLGTAYFNLGRFSEARAEFQAALRINPNHVQARQHLAAVEQRFARP